MRAAIVALLRMADAISTSQLHLHPAVDSEGEQFPFFSEAGALAWPQRTADVVLGKLMKYLAISVTVGMLISVAKENVFGNRCQKMNCRWTPSS